MPPPLKLRPSIPISHTLSLTFSTGPSASATFWHSIRRPISPPRAVTFLFTPIINAHQQLSLRGGGSISPCARLNALSAHVKPPTQINPLAFSSSIFTSSIAVNPNFNERAVFRFLSVSRGVGEEVSPSGSQDPIMSPHHSQNDDGSPRLSGLEDEYEEKHARLLTLPTVLTLARVAAVPAFVCTFYVNSWWGPTATTSIFIAAAVTDWLDGYLARKMRQGTAFGAFLDPVADKLMVATTLVLLCSRPMEVPIFGDAAWLFPLPSIAIIGREITMSAVREWAASQKGKLSEAVAVNKFGKWKTATQMISLTILLACRDSSLGGTDMFIASGVVLLYISAWLAVWSLFVYMRKIWKVLLRRQVYP